MRLKRKLRKGFTLVELVVVIAVIAILAAVSVGAYFGVTDSANSSNATTALKQVKDMWLLYSVEEYDSSMSEEEVGNGFAVDYLAYQGYNSYVNYAVVNYQENPNYQSQSNDTSETGVLFKIETQYPTWILVEGDRIIAESEVCKTEEDFINSLSSGKYIINFEGEFTLSTLIDSEGTKVRAASYVKYVIKSNADNINREDVLYLKSGKSLAEENNFYIPGASTGLVQNGDIQIQAENLWDMYQIHENGNETSFDTTMTVDGSNNIIEAIPEVEGIKNGYVTKVINLNQKYANLSSVTFDVNEYPVIVKAGNNFIAYKSLDALVGNYLDKDGNEHPNLPENTSYTKNNLLTYNYILCYGKNARLTENLNVPSGYIVGVDFNEFQGLNTIKDFVEKYLSKIDNNSKVNLTYKTINNDKLYDYISTSSSNEFTLFETDLIDYDKTTNQKTFRKHEVAKEINSFTITETGTLNLSNDSNVFVESHLVVGNGTNQGIGMKNHGAIYIDKGQSSEGIINLSSSSEMRILGKVWGDGTIKTNSGSTVYDVFKPNSFLGGTITLAHKNTEPTPFPFYNYNIDNIVANLEINSGCKYMLVCGFHANGDINFANPIFFAGGENDQAFFKLGTDASVIVSFNTDTLRTNFTFVKGQIYMGSIVLSIASYKFDTSNMQFPLTNIDLHVLNEATFNFNLSSTQIVLYPNSSIKNSGTININNGTKIYVLNFESENYQELLGDGTNKGYLNSPKENDPKYYNDRYLLGETKYSINSVLVEFYESLETECCKISNLITNVGTINIDSNSDLFVVNEIVLENINDESISNSNGKVDIGLYTQSFVPSDKLQDLYKIPVIGSLINATVNGLMKLSEEVYLGEILLISNN